MNYNKPTYTNPSQTDSSTGVSAVYLGPAPDATCKSLVIDTYGGQAIVSVYEATAQSGVNLR